MDTTELMDSDLLTGMVAPGLGGGEGSEEEKAARLKKRRAKKSARGIEPNEIIEMQLGAGQAFGEDQLLEGPYKCTFKVRGDTNTPH